MKICSIILSAGKGSRMLSSTPKPLHTISGKTMLQWVIDANQSAGIKKSASLNAWEPENDPVLIMKACLHAGAAADDT